MIIAADRCILILLRGLASFLAVLYGLRLVGFSKFGSNCSFWRVIAVIHLIIVIIHSIFALLIASARFFRKVFTVFGELEILGS